MFVYKNSKSAIHWRFGMLDVPFTSTWKSNFRSSFDVILPAIEINKTSTQLGVRNEELSKPYGENKKITVGNHFKPLSSVGQGPWESRKNLWYLILYVPTAPYASKSKYSFALSFSTTEIRSQCLNTWLNSCGLF